MSRRKTHATGNNDQPKENGYFPKKFVARLRGEYTSLTAAIRGIEDEAGRARYASVLLYRLMFLYFLQHRGLLAGDGRYLQRHLALAHEQHEDGESFYHDFLHPLFVQTVRSGHFIVPLAALFYAHPGERDCPALALPDAIFERIFAFFDEYQWQSDNQPVSSKNVLNPDMLASLFEQDISQKAMGAYYTPADVTDYIARSTLLPVLFTRTIERNANIGGTEELIWQQFTRQPERYIFPAVRLGSSLPLPPEISDGLQDVTRRQSCSEIAPRLYALPGETWREVIVRREHLQEIRDNLSQDAPDRLHRLVTWNLDQHQLALDILRDCQQPAFLEA